MPSIRDNLRKSVDKHFQKKYHEKSAFLHTADGRFTPW
jgi:hypothetical protein